MRSILLFVLSAVAWIIAAATSSAQDPMCSSNGVWVSPGEGVKDSAFGAVVLNDRLYLLHGEFRYPRSAMKISSWDGTRWSDVVDFSLRYEYNWYIRLAFTVVQGKLTLTGSMDSLNALEVKGGFVQWNGSAWEYVAYPPQPITIAPQTLVDFRGDTYASGRFNMGGTEYRLIRRRGGVWEGIGAMNFSDDTLNHPLLKVDNDVLYIVGNFDSINGMPMQGVARWDGTQFTPFGNLSISNVTAVEILDGDLYISGFIKAGTNQWDFGRWDGKSWLSYERVRTGRAVNPVLKAFRGRLYYRKYGYDRSIYRWYRGGEDRVSDLEGAVNQFIEFRGNLYAIGPLYQSCGASLSTFAMLCTDENCASVSGRIFHDADVDCIADASEPGVPRQMVQFDPSGHIAATDDAGYFRILLPQGEYTVRPLPRRHRTFCPAEKKVLVNDPPGGAAAADFGVQFSPARDLRISVAGNLARPGRSTAYTIRYENVGTLPTAGSISFDFDSRLRFESSSVSPSRQMGTHLEWDIPVLAPDEWREITVGATVWETTPVGTYISSYAVANPLAEDAWPADNRDSSCTVVIGSYDPNDIAVTPGSFDGSIHDLRLIDSVLAYRVRFQNTGNDTAFKVVILDTLDAVHDISTVIPGAASHPYVLDIPYPGVLRFTFDNILLPDSNINERASHGFVKYTVRLKDGLPRGTVIPNQASIYFDFNAPVLTNTVRTRIPLETSMDTTSHEDTLTYYLPTRCPGHTERVILPFYNLTRIDDAVAVKFNGERGGDYSLDTTLPFALTPTRTIHFPVVHRWTTPGRHETMMEILTSSGLVHRIRLVAPASNAVNSVLNVKGLHLGSRTGDFDTCFMVTNTFYTRVVLGDTSWSATHGSYSLLSPSLPYDLRAGDSVRLCLRVTGHGADSRATLNIGGMILDRNGIEQCVVQTIAIDAQTASPTLSVGNDNTLTGEMRCYPNPSSGRIHIEFPVYTRGKIRLALLDMHGAQVALLDNTTRDPGRNTIEYDAAHLPNGTYLVRIEQGGRSQLQMISIVR